jgi:membrane protease YdiL (CAAX protease family)
LNRPRVLEIGVRVAAGIAVLGAIGTLFADGPYLSASKGVEPWLAVWAVGIFGLLMYVPFALHRRAAAESDDSDRNWERAVVGWGGVALVAGAVFALILWVGPGPSHAIGALALAGLIEAGLIVVAVLAVILST